MKARDLDGLRRNSTISFFVPEQGYRVKGYFRGAVYNMSGQTVDVHVDIAGIGFITKKLHFEDEVEVVSENRYYHFTGGEAIQYGFTSANEIWTFLDDRKGQDWVDENIKSHMDWIVKIKGVLIRLSDEQFKALTDGFEEDE